MSEQDNIRIVQQVYDNFKNGNIQGLLNLLSDDIQWQIPTVANIPFTGTRRGRDKVADFFNQVAQNQDVINFDQKEFVAQGDRVVVIGHFAWRVKATGKNYESDYAHLWTVRGGKLTSVQEFVDTAAAALAYLQTQTAARP